MVVAALADLKFGAYDSYPVNRPSPVYQFYQKVKILATCFGKKHFNSDIWFVGYVLFHSTGKQKERGINSQVILTGQRVNLV